LEREGEKGEMIEVEGEAMEYAMGRYRGAMSTWSSLECCHADE